MILAECNIDLKTGIRYGVMPQHHILQAWADDSSPVYAEGEHDSDEHDQCDDPSWVEYNDDGYFAHQDSGSTDVWLERSPYFTYAPLCSPCAPNAGHLGEACEKTYDNTSGFKTYCFGAGWFEDNKAPYPVFNVKTGKLVE